MAKFDIHRRRGGNGFLLDCQADLLSDFNTRLVVPLLPEAEAPKPATRLNPAFEIQGERVIMATQFAAAVLTQELGKCVGSLLAEQDAVGNALDMLIGGF
jgi:toxin CcdB